MRRFDQATVDRITKAVATAEGGSAIEIVVRVVPRSGSYRDVALLVGFAVSLLALAAMLFGNFVVGPAWVIPDLVLLTALGYFATDRIPALVRGLTRAARRRQQVERGAEAAFYTEAISATRDRTGALVYCSALEAELVLVLDHPLEGRADGAAWGDIAAAARHPDRPLVERLVAMIEALGTLGATVAPRSADDVNELADAPRIGR